MVSVLLLCRQSLLIPLSQRDATAAAALQSSACYVPHDSLACLFGHLNDSDPGAAALVLVIDCGDAGSAPVAVCTGGAGMLHRADAGPLL